MSTPFTGSLANKRKNELVEIAQSLGLTDLEATIPVLRQNIQTYFDDHESSLSKDPQYKGLFHKKRSSREHEDGHPNGSPETPISVESIKNTLVETASRGRKSINKAVEKLQSLDAADIPLPESPMAKIQETVQDAANSSLALIQNPPSSREVTTRIKKVTRSLVKYGGEGQQRVEVVIDRLRNLLSTPEKLLLTATGIELAFLISHVVQFYNHTISFPPLAGESGTISSLLHALFFWLPESAFTLRTPELRGFSPTADLWPAFLWWFFTTIIPPLALSTLLTPSKGKSAQPTTTKSITNSSHSTTRSHHAQSQSQSYNQIQDRLPKPDPLIYSFIRLAIMLLPLTSAAPSSLVDSLQLSGDAQGRALGAGLVAALILGERIGSRNGRA